MQRALLSSTALFAFHKLGVSYRDRGKLEKFLLSPERRALAIEEQERAAACLVLWRKQREEGRGFGDIHLEATEKEVAAKREEWRA